MADLTQTERSGTVRVVGGDEAYEVDVELKADGTKRLLVDAETSPRSVAGLFIEEFENAGSTDFNVNGSATPVEFTIPLSNDDRAINSISLYGRDAGIKFGQFLAINQPLTNGVLIEIKSEDNVYQSSPLIITDDFRNKFAISPSDFAIDVFSNEDVFSVAFVSPAPFIIRNQNTFTTPDYVKVIIRDNLNNINYFSGSVFGTFI
jgi:hypothetical protein